MSESFQQAIVAFLADMQPVNQWPVSEDELEGDLFEYIEDHWEEILDKARAVQNNEGVNLVADADEDEEEDDEDEDDSDDNDDSDDSDDDFDSDDDDECDDDECDDGDED